MQQLMMERPGYTGFQYDPAWPHRRLHAEIVRYCAKHKVCEATFGRRAMNDPAFVGRLRREAHSPTLKTVRRVLAFIREADHA